MMIAALLALAAAPQAAPAAPAKAPAPAAAPAATRYSLDTPIATIVADPAAKAVLDASVPGITSHPMYEQFKGMSLSQLAPLSGGRLTSERLAKAKADLAALK